MRKREKERDKGEWREWKGADEVHVRREQTRTPPVFTTRDPRAEGLCVSMNHGSHNMTQADGRDSDNRFAFRPPRP